jgi:hypothetical protein
MTDEKTLYKTTRLIWYLFYLLEVLLFFRFMLKLLSANPGAGFTNLIYSITAIPLAPFRFVFETNSVGSSIFEWSTILAMLVYWFVTWGIVKLVVMGREVNPHEAERSLEAQDNA